MAFGGRLSGLICEEYVVGQHHGGPAARLQDHEEVLAGRLTTWSLPDRL